jgi:2-iminobutanoate/2-iminopropanoate deaminase
MNSLVLAAVLSLSSLGAEAAEIAKYDLLFLAGQVGEYEDGKLVAGGIKAEAEQIMLNIKAALARRGLGLQHVVKCTVLLADIAEWGTFNEVYEKHFSQPHPARTAFGATGLVLNARAEMECVAGMP